MENYFDNVNVSVLMSESNNIKTRAMNLSNEINRLSNEIENYIRWTGVKKNEILSYYEILAKSFEQLKRIAESCSDIANLISNYKRIAEIIKREKTKPRPNYYLIRSYTSQLSSILSSINSRSNINISKQAYNYKNIRYSTTGFDYDMISNFNNKTLNFYSDFDSLFSYIKGTLWVTSSNSYVSRMGTQLVRVSNYISIDFPKLNNIYKILIQKVSNCIYDLKRIWNNPFPDYPNYIALDTILTSNIDADTKNKVNFWLNEIEEREKIVDEHDDEKEIEYKNDNIENEVHDSDANMEESNNIDFIEEVINVTQENNIDDNPRNNIMSQETNIDEILNSSTSDNMTKKTEVKNETIDIISSGVESNENYTKNEFMEQNQMEMPTSVKNDEINSKTIELETAKTMKIEENKPTDMEFKTVNLEQEQFKE